MKRNKNFLKKEKKTGENKTISEAEFVVRISVKCKKPTHFPLSSDSNHDLFNIIPEFSLK